MTILLHYAELALKLGNRGFFEKTLQRNLEESFDEKAKVERLFGRFLLEAKIPFVEAKDILAKTPGLAWFAPIIEVKSLEELKKILKNFTKGDYQTFCVRVNRVDKNFPKTSMELEKELGEMIRKSTHKKVDLGNPEKTFFIEILSKRIFLFTEKIRGLGGLPIGVSGKVMVLLSGGIDSPVSSFLMLKRGAKLSLVHFHSFPYLDKASIEKCREIKMILKKYQLEIDLFLVPFFECQKALKLKIDNRYLVVLYRRLMLKICETLAKKEGAGGLVTGESLGQVASQTLENIGVINQAVSLLILRPLIGLNKEEIIKIAQEIGTYEVSIKNQKDCCSLFLPKHPVLKADLAMVLKMEKQVDIKKLRQQAIKNTEWV